MSAEEIIRAKHRVENEVAELKRRLRGWSSEVDSLTTQQLELVAAKVLDGAIEAPNDRQLKLKLHFLRAALGRRSPTHHISAWKGFWLAVPETFFDRLMRDALPIPAAVDDSTLIQIAEAS